MLTSFNPLFKNALITISLTVVLPQAAYSESLLEVYQKALANDPELKAQQAAFEASQDIVNIQQSVNRPQINGEAGYGTSHTSTSQHVNSSTDSIDFTLSISQSLLNFQNRYLIEGAQIQEQIAAMELASAEQSLLLRSAEAYFNVLNAFDQLRSAQTEQTLLANRLEQIQERFDVGLIPINDVLEAQANLDTAIATTLAADANLGVERENLASISGSYSAAIAPLKAGFNAPSPQPDDRQTWLDQALQSNLALKIQSLRVDAANSSHRATQHADSPTLSGTAGLSRNEDLQSSGNSRTTSLGVTLSVPLYAGGRYSAQKRQSAQDIIQAQERLRLAQRNTVRDARSLFLSLKSSEALLKAREQVIISTQSALNASQAGYDAGIRDIIDVNNAQKEAFQAQRNYSTALYGYLLDSLNLKALAGLLTVADLEALDNALDKNSQLTLNDFSVVN